MMNKVNLITPSRAGKRPRKVFLVEDDLQMKRLYRYEFQKQGISMKHFETGFELLEAVKQEKPDLILMDLLMPGLNGLEVLKALRENDKTCDIPVVTYSSLAKKMVAEKAKKAGARLHLGKSDYTPAEIVKKVFQLIK